MGRRRGFEKRKIFEPQIKFQRYRRKKKILNAFFVFLGLVGMGMILAGLVAEGVVESSPPVDWWWYGFGAALMFLFLVYSIWKIFWL